LRTIQPLPIRKGVNPSSPRAAKFPMIQDKRHLKLLAADAGSTAITSLPSSDGYGVDFPDEVGEAEPSEYLQVGDLAKSTGKTVRAIHLYESLGLLEPARRSRGGYRLFAPTSPDRVRWISKLQSLGLSLSEIQGVAERRRSSSSAKTASSELLSVYETKLADIRERLAEYRALEQELVASVKYLQECQLACVGETHVSGCSRCDRHQDEPAVPELVSGARI
jgi:MerR family transcriptional regulator, copper efflux regulator